MFVIYFFLWTLLLYGVHRLVHILPYIKKIHNEHHRYVMRNKDWYIKWEDLYLSRGNNKVTVDLWITEVIPTLLFCAVTGHWWIFGLYYGWSAFYEKTTKYNRDVDVFLVTWGMWTLTHYRRTTLNFGGIFSLWDMIFKTNRGINQI